MEGSPGVHGVEVSRFLGARAYCEADNLMLGQSPGTLAGTESTEVSPESAGKGGGGGHPDSRAGRKAWSPVRSQVQKGKMSRVGSGQEESGSWCLKHVAGSQKNKSKSNPCL